MQNLPQSRRFYHVALIVLYAGAGFVSTRSHSQEEPGDLIILRPAREEIDTKSKHEGWEELGGGLFQKHFYLPPTFTGSERSATDEPDPFASGSTKPSLKRRTAQEILSDKGIKFAEGTSAIYNPANSYLLVVQTDDQIEAVELFCGEITQGAENLINIRAEVFEVTPPQGMQVIESAQSEGEHTPERNALMKSVRSGGVKLIAFPSVICRSGLRAMTLEEIVSAEEASSTGNEAEKSENQAENTPISISKLEADAVLGADEFTIDLNFSLSISEPLKPGEAGADVPGRFRQRTITTQATVMNGNHHLIGSWSAPGDRVYLVFLSAHLQQIEPVRKAPAKSE